MLDAAPGFDKLPVNHRVAIGLAKQGIAVFPCRWEDNDSGKAKAPLYVLHWKADATTDIDIINAWWGAAPNALVGMPLAPLNLVVLDPDRHPGAPDGVAAFEELAKAHPGLLGGPYVETPQGRHYIYQQPAKRLGNGEGKLPPGINVRGDGGYVIAPGSVLPDGRTWVMHGGTQPRQLPLAVIDMLQGKAPESNAKTFHSEPNARERAYTKAACENASEKVRAAQPGHRNNTLNTQAIKLSHFVIAEWLSESEMIELLTDAAIEVGLGDSEISATIRSALDGARKNPRRPRVSDDDTVNEFWDGDLGDAAPAPPPRRIHRAADMWHAPKPEYLIDGMIPKGGVGLLIGDTQTFKSFIAQSMALAISQAMPTWEGHAIQAPPDAAVLYIAGEGGIDGASLRMRAWAEKHGLTESTFIDRFRLITFQVNLGDAKTTKELVKLIQQEISDPIAMIVIDTLNTSAPGAEENSTKEMGALYSVCRNIATAFAAAVLGVHHTNKQGKARGANLLQQNADFLLFMERPPKTFPTMNTTLTVTKLKDGASGHKEHYHLDLVALDDQSTSLVPHRIGALQAEKTETVATGRPTSRIDAIISVLTDSQRIDGETRSEICAILDITETKEKNAVSQALRRLLGQGLVVRDKGKWRVTNAKSGDDTQEVADVTTVSLDGFMD